MWHMWLEFKKKTCVWTKFNKQTNWKDWSYGLYCTAGIRWARPIRGILQLKTCLILLTTGIPFLHCMLFYDEVFHVILHNVNIIHFLEHGSMWMWVDIAVVGLCRCEKRRHTCVYVCICVSGYLNPPRQNDFTGPAHLLQSFQTEEDKISHTSSTAALSLCLYPQVCVCMGVCVCGLSAFT